MAARAGNTAAKEAALAELLYKQLAHGNLEHRAWLRRRLHSVLRPVDAALARLSKLAGPRTYETPTGTRKRDVSIDPEKRLWQQMLRFTRELKSKKGRMPYNDLVDYYTASWMNHMTTINTRNEFISAVWKLQRALNAAGAAGSASARARARRG